MEDPVINSLKDAIKKSGGSILVCNVPAIVGVDKWKRFLQTKGAKGKTKVFLQSCKCFIVSGGSTVERLSLAREAPARKAEPRAMAPALSSSFVRCYADVVEKYESPLGLYVELGDRIVVTKQVNDHWYLASRDGTEPKLVPAKCIHLLVNGVDSPAPPPGPSAVPEQAAAPVVSGTRSAADTSDEDDATTAKKGGKTKTKNQKKNEKKQQKKKAAEAQLAKEAKERQAKAAQGVKEASKKQASKILARISFLVVKMGRARLSELAAALEGKAPNATALKNCLPKCFSITTDLETGDDIVTWTRPLPYVGKKKEKQRRQVVEIVRNALAGVAELPVAQIFKLVKKKAGEDAFLRWQENFGGAVQFVACCPEFDVAVNSDDVLVCRLPHGQGVDAGAPPKGKLPAAAEDDEEDVAGPAPTVSTVSEQPGHSQPSEVRPAKSVVLRCNADVVLSYDGSRSGGLKVAVGDRIVVTKKVNDFWYLASHNGTGLQLGVPAHCIKLIPASLPAALDQETGAFRAQTSIPTKVEPVKAKKKKKSPILDEESRITLTRAKQSVGFQVLKSGRLNISDLPSVLEADELRLVLDATTRDDLPHTLRVETDATTGESYITFATSPPSPSKKSEAVRLRVVELVRGALADAGEMPISGLFSLTKHADNDVRSWIYIFGSPLVFFACSPELDVVLNDDGAMVCRLPAQESEWVGADGDGEYAEEDNDGWADWEEMEGDELEVITDGDPGTHPRVPPPSAVMRLALKPTFQRPSGHIAMLAAAIVTAGGVFTRQFHPYGNGWSELMSLLRAPPVEKIMHDCREVYVALEGMGCTMQGIFDTQVAYGILERTLEEGKPADRKRLAFDEMCQRLRKMDGWYPTAAAEVDSLMPVSDHLRRLIGTALLPRVLRLSADYARTHDVQINPSQPPRDVDLRLRFDDEHRAVCSLPQDDVRAAEKPSPGETGLAGGVLVDGNEMDAEVEAWLEENIARVEAAEKSAQEDSYEMEQLLGVLPPALRTEVMACTAANPSRQLIEVVCDAGRPSWLQFSDGPVKAGTADIEVALDLLAGATSARRQTYEEFRYDDLFTTDRRAGISGTLHRICAISDAHEITGLTYRIGRHIPGTAACLEDLLHTLVGHAGPRSILLLGQPGRGKTTLLRDVVSRLARAYGPSVVVVDTSSEIAGDGRVPHSCIGDARRVPVPVRDEQHSLLLQTVQNHTPKVIVIDEIGDKREVAAVLNIARRGVSVVATAHGASLHDLLKNPELVALVGGVAPVTLGAKEAAAMKANERSRGTAGSVAGTSQRFARTVLNRKGAPAFQYLVEVVERGKFRVHTDLKHSVDSMLDNQSPPTQVRWTDPSGNMWVRHEGVAHSERNARASWLDDVQRMAEYIDNDDAS